MHDEAGAPAPVADAAAAASAKPSRPPRGPVRWGRRLGWAAAALLLALVALAGVVRVGVRTDPGRALVVRFLNGLPLGAAGRLQVEGLRGDLLHDFGRPS